MPELELILFDDAVGREWYPFTWTRPAGELLLGTRTLRARLEAVTHAKCAGYLTDVTLIDYDEPNTPKVLPTFPATQRPRIYLSSRCVLHWDVNIDVTQESTLNVGNQIAGWVLPAGVAPPTQDDLLVPSSKRGVEQDLGGTLIDNVWDLITHNLDHVASDVLHFHPNPVSTRPRDVYLVGDYPLVCGDNVTIEPGVVFELSAGPVWLDDGVTVRALSRIEGPLYAGKDSVLLGGSFSSSSIGPACKIHGEIEGSIILGYSNKAHDGFLGHAYVGMWVNLGALTTNSDLKNNYSSVRIKTLAREVDTGMMKLGALIADHVKTAIGTMLNTGTVIGPGANVFGGMPGKYVPPFSWGITDGRYELDKFLDLAERVMKRRKQELSESQRRMLTRVWQVARYNRPE